MNQNNYLVVMAGGIGSRFWPVSTAQKPKQFLDMLGTGRTLFQHTIDRFKGICPLENILVVTSENYTGIVKEQCPELLDGNILAEPCMRNTAPCIAYASYKIKKLNPNANIVVSPADHLIDEFDIFENTVKTGLDFTASNKAILTLGILPHKPETGYGYIQTADKTAEIASVKAFKEKPDLETAKKYLADGGYYWNAGIFFWSVSTIIEAFENITPLWRRPLRMGSSIFTQKKKENTSMKCFPLAKTFRLTTASSKKQTTSLLKKPHLVGRI